ncbi:MAG: HEPN domain-containing protein [Pseudomonadota bacterium]
MKREEWERYRRQARHTLDSARRDQAVGDHDWACFKAQQAAELAVKGFVRATRRFVTGHSVVKLLAESETQVPAAILDCARELDKVYIPSRYPDAYDWGSPMDYYRETDAQKAIACAASVLEWLDALAAA